MNNRGFTLLELMVASLLLAMLVTAITMIFNQSSIAWRTGVAGVVELGGARQSIGEYQEVCDEIIPKLNNRDTDYRTVSVWDSDNNLRKGGTAVSDATSSGRPLATHTVALPSADNFMKGAAQSVSGVGPGQSSSLYIVGVRSLGKDGLPETDDDVTTWPEGVD